MTSNETRASDTTDTLIKGLAAQAGKRQPARPSFGAALSGILPVALLASVAVVLMTAGARPDLTVILLTWTFQFKVIGMVLIGIGACRLVWSAVRPGVRVHPVLCLGPGGVFLLGGALLDQSGFPLLGLRTLSAANCAGVIILSSLPALAAVLLVMRNGTPTHLKTAGALAGLLAGSIGALAYTIACLNDGAGFVALWYSAAILVVSTLGAIIGPKALAW
jgi:hypothetical protein